MRKKLLTIALSAIMVVAMAVPAFASVNVQIEQKDKALMDLKQRLFNTVETVSKQESIEKVIDFYLSDNDVFLNHFTQNSADALQMVETMVDRELQSATTPTLFWDHITSWGVSNVPSFKQRTPTWCGVASATQVILGLGKTLSGTDYSAKQLTVGNYLGLPNGGSAMVNQIRTAIRNFAPNSNYGYTEATNMSFSTFISIVKNNLISDRPIILHAIPKYISTVYPSSATTGHYIVIDEMRLVGGEYFITINDCNYQDSYFGRRRVPAIEAYNSIHSVSGRYLIY